MKCQLVAAKILDTHTQTAGKSNPSPTAKKLNHSAPISYGNHAHLILCRVWKLSRAKSSANPEDHVPQDMA